MRDLLFIAVVVISSLIALRRPVFGILTFICLGFLNPQSMTWTIGRNFRFAQITGISTIVGYLFWQEPKRFPRQRESLLLLALWGMFGVSTLFAIFPENALEFLIHVSKILLVAILCTSLINNEHRLHWLLRVISLSIGFYGLKGGVFFLITGGNYMVWGPEGSFLFANNSIGLAFAMNVPLLFYLSKVETHKWLRWIMRTMLVFSYPATIGTFSRGAWLGLAVGTALMVIKGKYRFILVPMIAILAIFSLPYLPQIFPQRVVDRYGALVDYEQERSAQSRFWNWECCKRVGMANPLHGGGFDFYSKEVYERYFPEFLERWPGKLWTCHSVWFTIFGEHGFPGLFLWFALITSCFLSLRQMRLYGKIHIEMAWITHYVNMLQASLFVFMVVGTFVDAAYFDMFYYLVAVIIIIKERMRRLEFEPSKAITVTD